MPRRFHSALIERSEPPPKTCSAASQTSAASSGQLAASCPVGHSLTHEHRFAIANHWPYSVPQASWRCLVLGQPWATARGVARGVAQGVARGDQQDADRHQLISIGRRSIPAESDK